LALLLIVIVVYDIFVSDVTEITSVFPFTGNVMAGRIVQTALMKLTVEHMKV
jgi:hypothetical protein